MAKMTTKQLNTAIAALGKRNEKVEADIQTLGLECLAHLEEHGDTMPLNRLINVLRRGQHEAFMMWCMAFGKCAKNLTKDTMTDQPVVYAKERKTDLDGAIAKPWFMFAEDKPVAIAKAFDLQGAMMALLKRAATAGTDHTQLVAIAALVGIKPEKVPATITHAAPVELATVKS